MTTTELLSSAWDTSVALPLLCFAASAAYAMTTRGRAGARAFFFVLALVIFYLALASPIGVLARGYLFSAHMLQHLLLMLAVPPFFLLALPRATGPTSHVNSGGAISSASSWLAGVGGMWIWHTPVLCNAAAVNPNVQAFQTLTLLILGFLFWRPILAPGMADRMAAFPALIYLFTACLACTVLGVVVTLSPIEICGAYTQPVDALGVLPLLRNGWGLTCKVDQQIGGLMMWFPPCLVYGAAMLATLGRYYAEERVPHRALERIE